MKRAAIAGLTTSYDSYAGDPVAPAAPRGRLDPIELSAKVAIVSLFTIFAVRIGVDAIATGRLTGVLLLASEGLVVVLTVVRRQAGIVDRTWQSRLLTTISMMGPSLVYPSKVAALAPEAATVALSVAGLVVVVSGKLSLGRSFGLLPANRGIVCRGCYRVLRHPIYLGYLITHVAFLAANPISWNVAMLGIADIALLRRAVYEERTLARDDRYREYMTRVRWRIVPGVF